MDSWGRMVLGLLLSGNIFFVKRLVDEIDITQRMVVALDKKVAVLTAQLGIRDAAWTLSLKPLELKTTLL